MVHTGLCSLLLALRAGDLMRRAKELATGVVSVETGTVCLLVTDSYEYIMNELRR